MRRLICFLLLLMLCGVPLVAQETTPEAAATPEIDAERAGLIDAAFIAENNAPFIGEPVRVELQVEIPPGAAIIEWAEFPEDVEPFMVLSRSEITQEETADGTLHRQAFDIVLWDVGDYLTPEIPVRVNVAGSTSLFPVNSAFFSVRSVLGESPSLRPAIAPQDLPYVSPWLVVGATSAVIIVITTIIYLLRRGSRRVSRALRGTPTQITIAELEDLKAQAGDAAEIYPMVANILRRYLQKRYDIRAVEMTTNELMLLLSESNLSDDLRWRLRQLLEQADLVKFARFEPDTASTNRLLNYAIRWVREAGRTEIVKEPAHA